MKKFLSMVTLSTALLLTACGNDTEEPTEGATEDSTEEVAKDGLQDGTYRIEDMDFDETGWKEALEMVVADGKITEATWESVNEAGENKIEDEDYQETMTNVSGLGPQDFIPALEDDLVDTQDPADVEIITGATGTAVKFQDYAQQLVDAAKAGNTETIIVDNVADADSDLQDGTYRIEDAGYADMGYKESLEIVVVDGKITEANWGSEDEDGANKIDDDEYQETMTGTDGLGPQDFIPALEEDLVNVQDPAEVEIITGATGTANKFQDYAQQLVEAAKAGNTDTIVVEPAAE